MVTIIFFVGVTAAVGAVCYLAARQLVVDRWNRWQEDRVQTRHAQQREQRQKAMRDEAATSVLRQLAQREEAMQSISRKAA